MSIVHSDTEISPLELGLCLLHAQETEDFWPTADKGHKRGILDTYINSLSVQRLGKY